MRPLNSLDWIALIILVIGGINWGLVGLFQTDLVASLFGGPDSLVSKIIYVLVGLAAGYILIRATQISAETREPALHR